MKKIAILLLAILTFSCSDDDEKGTEEAFSGQKKHNASETMYYCISKSREAGPKTFTCRQN